MRSLFPLIAAALACGVAVAAPVPANPDAAAVTQRHGAPWVKPGQGAPDRDASNIGRTDRNFMADAARAGLAEIAAGKLALQRSHAPGIREYAEVLVKDHEAANAQLQQIAASKGVRLPTQPSHAQQRDLQHLQRLSGKDFDDRFLRQMVDDHQRAVDMFGHEIKGRHQDAELKNFAQQTLIGLEHHLAIAESLQKHKGQLPG